MYNSFHTDCTPTTSIANRTKLLMSFTLLEFSMLNESIFCRAITKLTQKIECVCRKYGMVI